MRNNCLWRIPQSFSSLSRSIQKSDPDFESTPPKTVPDIELADDGPKLSLENLLNNPELDVPDFKSDPKPVPKPDVFIPESELVQQTIPDLKIPEKSVPDLESAPKLTFQPDPENVIMQTIIKVKKYYFRLKNL